MPTTAEIKLRDHVRYHMDGLPNDPGPAHPAPYGDPKSGVHNPSKRDLRDAIGSVTDAADAANAAADRANTAAALLETASERLGPLENIDQVQTRLQRGQAVKFACYGDSTTDGWGTTGWTQNDGGNHESQAPNAWPKKLKSLLQDMYPQAGALDVWNAGWSGQSLANGWARSNYDLNVISTYGTPDVCFVQFGANDVTLAGWSLENYISETRLLIEQIIADGTLPILLTCDPMVRNSAPRMSWQVSREIDAAKVQIARERGIPLIDVSTAIRDWLGRNTDGMQWGRVQPDGLHGGDEWHKYKAAFIASELYRDVFRIAPGESRRLPLFDSGSNMGGVFEGVTTVSKNAIGGNVAYNIARGTVVADAWIWNENPDARLMYQTIESEGDTTALPYAIGVAGWATRVDAVQGGGAAHTPPTAGFSRRSDYRQSDMPMDMGKLAVGLTRARYYSAGVSSYCGYFDVLPTARSVPPASWRFTGSGFQVAQLPDPARQYVVGTPGNGQKQLDIFVDAAIPNGCGVILTASQCWGTGAEYGDIAGVFLFRNGSGNYGVSVFRKIGATATYLASGGVSYTAITGTQFRVRFQRTSTQQIVSLYDGWGSGAAASSVTYTTADGVMGWGGTMGGAVADMSIAAAGATVILNSMHAEVS